METKHRRKHIREATFACWILLRAECDNIGFTRNLYIDYAKDEPHFGSVMYGPILLAGGLGTDDMPEDRVIDNRACRESLPAKNIPMLVGPLADLDSWIQCSSQHPLRFTVKNGGGQQGVGLIPYFQMHHQRHTVYWKLYSPDEFVYRTRSLTDEVKIGDRKDERKHALQGERMILFIGMIILGKGILGSVWQKTDGFLTHFI